jgi:uncharacterized membrane protein YfcA
MQPHPSSLGVQMYLQRTGSERQERLACQISEADLPRRGKSMFPRRYHHQAIGGERMKLKAFRIDGIRQHANFREAQGDAAGNVNTLTFLQLDIDLRVDCKPGCQAGRQELGHCGRVRQHADGAANALGILPDLAPHLRHLVQDHPGVVEQRAAGLGRHHAAAVAIEQADPACGLHVAQPLAGRWERQANLSGTVRDAARLGHREKQPKICQIEAHSRQPSTGSAFGTAEHRLRHFRIVQRPAQDITEAMSDISVPLFLAIGATFFAAGTVKGVTGMGLPTVAMGVLGALISPLVAASLLIVPSFATNVWQLLAGPAFHSIGRRLWPMMLAICAGTMLGAAWLASGDAGATTTLLGVALVIYAGYTLLARQLAVPKRLEPLLAPLVGGLTGIVSGATGVFVIPAVPYLQALGLSRDDLVQALGLSFTVSTVALAIALGAHGAFAMDTMALSLLALVPAMTGMWAGQKLRNRISPATFRKVFLVFLLLLGTEMTFRPLL